MPSWRVVRTRNTASAPALALQLYRPLEKSRAENVSAYALAVGALNSNSVASILSNSLDLAVRAQEEGDGVDTRANVGGPLYFQK